MQRPVTPYSHTVNQNAESSRLHLPCCNALPATSSDTTNLLREGDTCDVNPPRCRTSGFQHRRFSAVSALHPKRGHTHMLNAVGNLAIQRLLASARWLTSSWVNASTDHYGPAFNAQGTAPMTTDSIVVRWSLHCICGICGENKPYGITKPCGSHPKAMHVMGITPDWCINGATFSVLGDELAGATAPLCPVTALTIVARYSEAEHC